MRIAVAEIAQETDSFSPMTADLRDFETYGLYFGAEILEKMDGVGPLGGLLQIVAEQQDRLGDRVELVPIVRAWAAAGGTITTETLEFLTGRLVAGLREALPLDAVFLSLHGAASAECDDDVEGYVLQATRAVVGDQVPIICPLDHHANVTERMIRYADVLVGHKTQPHDPPDTGRHAAEIMFRMLPARAATTVAPLEPTVGWRKIPMITPQDQFLTSQGPMKAWFDLAQRFQQDGRVIDVTPYPMQPWLDVAEGGWSVVVYTDKDPELADAIAVEMAQRAWQLRDQFWVSQRVAPADAVRQAVAAERGLVILSDTGDSVYGGAPGDSTIILRELLAQEIPVPAFVPVIDPAAVELACEAGVGGEVAMQLGGHVDNVFSQPLSVHVRVAAVSNGVTVSLGDRGVCALRRTALLELGQIRIVVLDHRSFAINHPVLYTHLGLDMNDAKMVVVKTASNFQFFERWRHVLLRVDSGGMTQSDLTAFAWKRLPRPIYPLDRLDDWRAS